MTQCNQGKTQSRVQKAGERRLLGATGGKKQKNEGVEQVAIRDEGRLSYHPELAAGVNFLSRVQTLQAWVMFSQREGPAGPALAMSTRVAAAEGDGEGTAGKWCTASGSCLARV